MYELLTAAGELDDNNAISYFVGNPTVDKITDNVTRMFLGVQLQCAQCHNHPFVDYKQTEYWGMAQFFMKVRVNNQLFKKGGKGPPMVNVYEGPPPAKGRKGQALPSSAKIVPAKFLRGEEPKLNPLDQPGPCWLPGSPHPVILTSPGPW